MANNAYDEGMKAYQLNKRKATNPYDKGTKDHNEWNNGWEYAQDTEDDLLIDVYE